MISEDVLRQKVLSFARLVDIDPPEVKVLPRLAGTMGVRLTGRTLRIESHTLEELSEPELDFALALAVARYVRTRWTLAAVWTIPIALCGLMGFLVLMSDRDHYAKNPWLGFGIVFGAGALGYVVSEVLNAWFNRADQNNVFHDALMLSGSATAAESYLIRLQADRGANIRRRRLSQRRKDILESQLQSLEDACRRLGLTYRAVTSRLS